MQIEIYSPTNHQPLPPVEWNYTAVKQWLEDGLAAYKGRVYTDATINEAKKDRANLNKLADAIDGKRKEMKATYLEPYALFESQAKELTAMVKAQVAEIDAQVKTYDNFRKEQKLERIKTELYEPMIGNLGGLVPYDRLHEVKWLNVTMSIPAVAEEMACKIDKITAGLSAIDTLDLAADIAVQVKDVFLKRFDLAAAIAEKDRLIRQKAELERLKAAPTAPVEEKYTPAEPEKPAAAQSADDTDEEKVHTVTFRIHVTASQLKRLGEFMKINGIRPERV